MNSLTDAPVSTPGATLSPVRTIQSVPAPRSDHLSDLADQLGDARLLLAMGDREGASAVLTVTQHALRNLAAAMVTR